MLGNTVNKKAASMLGFQAGADKRSAMLFE